MKKEIATLGAGCFWCVEAMYQPIQGVLSVTSGYSGGSEATADYKMVCSKLTKHAEVVQVEFDAEVLSYAEVLEMFWVAHDPTQLNRQGNDVGPQYRSVIFYHDEAQRSTAEKSITTVATEIHDAPIVTELAAFEAFYPAEVEHHDYYNRVGDQNPYCAVVISPKVAKFRKKFAARMK